VKQARHLWRTWDAVSDALGTDRTRNTSTPKRTRRRWVRRLCEQAAHTYYRRFQVGDDWVEQAAGDALFTDRIERRYDTVTRMGTLTTPAGRVTDFRGR